MNKWMYASKQETSHNEQFDAKKTTWNGAITFNQHDTRNVNVKFKVNFSDVQSFPFFVLSVQFSALGITREDTRLIRFLLSISQRCGIM